MAYAVFESGGKQYVARHGQTIDIDRIKVEVGEQLTFDQVLLTADDGQVVVGEPFISGAAVTAKVVGQVKGPKILVFKYKPKVRYRKRQGHRQHYTRVQIDAIELAGGKPAKRDDKPVEAMSEKPAAKPTEKPAARPTAEAVDLDSMLKADLEALAEELGVMPETGSGAGGNVLVQDLRDAIRKAQSGKRS
jgi:large subunit ribosomal protein L21